jgi:NAD(P)-dependent dehydrogenase (short-subunit alcohol dehydrogenase family)
MEAVVITGASSGIGYDATLYLTEQGFHVFAGVRKEEDADRLRKIDNVTPIFIDVTDEEMIKTAANHLVKVVGDSGIAGLVNNAGIAVMSPLEFIPMEDLRKQIEINTIGQVAVTQAFLPLLRKAKGRILNISSLSGTMVFPYMGAYAASKHALEAVTDALRQELCRWEIDVISIEPGSVETPIWDKEEQTARQRVNNFPPEANTLYGEQLRQMEKVVKQTGQRGMPVRRISEVIHTALTAKKPKTRYFIVNRGWRMRLLRLLPDRWRDALLRRAMGL